MSKIQDELIKATDLKKVRNEDPQDHIRRLLVAVSALADADYEALSEEATAWFNDAADAHESKKKVLPGFPDEGEGDDKEEEKTISRRGSSKTTAPKIGVVAKVTTKRGQSTTGTIVEIDDEVIVLKMGDGSEKEFDRSRVESIEVAGEGDAEDDPIKVGAVVTATTKRGKDYTGKIVEIDDEVIVLDIDGKDEELSRDRVELIKVINGGKEEPKSSGRRGVKTEPEDDGKKTRASNGSVSVGQRIRELMCEDLGVTEAQVEKVLKKEGLEFRETTLKMIFKDTAVVFELLKKFKKLK